MEINRGSTVCPRFIHGLSTVYPWFVHGSVGMWAYETAESMSVFWRGNQQGLKGKKQLFYKDGLFYSRGSPGLTIYIYMLCQIIFSHCQQVGFPVDDLSPCSRRWWDLRRLRRKTVTWHQGSVRWSPLGWLFSLVFGPCLFEVYFHKCLWYFNIDTICERWCHQIWNFIIERIL